MKIDTPEKKFDTFDAIRIGLASPEMIESWSNGEVKKPETINYRTLKPETDGLFCERIFGPIKDWECHCGKYKRIRFKGKVCERCGVEITTSKVRRERMGHIVLAAPVSHIWYFKGIPSRMGLILDITPRVLEKVLYFASYIVIDPGNVPGLEKYQPLSEREYREYYEKYENDFRAGMGAEAIKELLAEIDLDKLAEELKQDLESSSGQKKMRAIKRLEVVEAFRQSGNRPEWMILDVIPVIPPEIRPMVQIDGGRFATSDLNDLYRRVINRNNRLKKLLELAAPDIIIRNEKRMLQEAVDALIDNGRRGRAVTGPSNRALKSLSDMLRGKQGRFRQNLLGKRVDYSGRSVIVVGPELKIYQCGLPKEMALELFKPFIMKRLVSMGVANNIKSAKKMVERVRPEVWDALEEVIKGHPVMLNRAPTLHRLGIQAFEVVLVEGRALKLHPLVCTAFNADFDGDQMAVHVPLSAEAQAEARFLMLSANNLLKPQDGKPVAVPSQDMVLGSYYLTKVRHGEPGEGLVFRNFDEVMMAYQTGNLGIHAPIKVRVEKVIDGVKHSRIINATAGQIIFNENIPQDLGYVDRTNPETMLDLEVSFVADKGALGKIIDRCIKVHGTTATAEILDKVKATGYKFSTRGGLTMSIYDMIIPEKKKELVEAGDKKVDVLTAKYRRGLISEEEKTRLVVDTWTQVTKEVADAMIENLDEFNPIFMMANSGARGSIKQIRQLGGMRGLMASATGRTLEIPIRANFREGLTVLEYFISSRGARKALSDTALRTADSGYLTRRLVDVSQEVIIREEDCGTDEGIYVSDIYIGKEEIELLAERLVGRVAAEDVIHPETGEVIVAKGTLMKDAEAKKITAAGVKRVKIHSILTCKAKRGVCAKCYGANLASGQLVSIGEAVGIIAAQSIGEPGTQLTMRTFHTGGVAGSDITQGLPRVEELFEARRPKTFAVLAEIDGVVSIPEGKNQIKIFNSETLEEATYSIAYNARLRVSEGSVVKKGDELTEGSLNPHDVLAIRGPEAAQNCLIEGVQHVYRSQAVSISDKHIEVIVRQMMRKVRIEDPGDTNLVLGSMTEVLEYEAANKEIDARIAAGEQELRKAVATPVLLGITKASLATDSFLSAASFQETARVLTDAAIKGKIDPLLGLKENVIIGKLIPAGTGVPVYRDVDAEEIEQQPVQEEETAK